MTLKWPGYRQDDEDGRLQQEQKRVREIKAENLSARIRAADPVQRDRRDPAAGATFGDAAARGLYDDASRVQSYRDLCDRARRTREGLRRAQARIQGRQGRN